MEIGSRKFVGNEAYKGGWGISLTLKFSKVIGEIAPSTVFLKKKKKKEFAKQIHMHDPPSSLVWVPLAWNSKF